MSDLPNLKTADARERGVTLLELVITLVLFGLIAIGALNLLQLSRKETTRSRTQLELQETSRVVTLELRNLLQRIGDGVDLAGGNCYAARPDRLCTQPRVIFADDYTLVFNADLDREDAVIDPLGPEVVANVQLMTPESLPANLYYFYLAGPDGNRSNGGGGGLENSDDPIVHPGVVTPTTWEDGDELTGSGCGRNWNSAGDNIAGGFTYARYAGPDGVWGTSPPDEPIIHPGLVGGVIDAWGGGNDLTGAGEDANWYTADDLSGPAADQVFGFPLGGACSPAGNITQRQADGTNWDLSGAETISLTLDFNDDGQVTEDDACVQHDPSVTNPYVFELGMRVNGGEFLSLTGCTLRGPLAYPDGTMPRPLFQYHVAEDLDGDGSINNNDVDINDNGSVDSEALFGDVGGCGGCVAADGILQQGEIEDLVLGNDGQLGHANPNILQNRPDETGTDTRLPWYYREEIRRIRVDLTFDAANTEIGFSHPDFGADYPYRQYSESMTVVPTGLRYSGLI
ncbi:MAG: type II secretion system protein [Candidatus Schekmanbacteria bacterium]|nr:type II secretion system protein [Candidatus Schekmanbacteria bacterium]